MQEQRMPNEELVVSNDQRSFWRGRRRAPRTPVCRPCLVWTGEGTKTSRKGVVLNLTPHGLLVRMLEENFYGFIRGTESSDSI